jgi:8-oxo-dGTP pyrophosphatase MutT (NUDIX family)
MKNQFRIAVMAIIVNNYNKVLIGSSPRDGGYKFPQGGLELNEDEITGVTRELNEELGISIVDTDITAVYSEKVDYLYPPEDPYFIYKGQRLSVIKIQYNTTMKLIPQDDEFDELYWIPPQDLHKYVTNFRFKAYHRALEICGLL